MIDAKLGVLLMKIGLALFGFFGLVFATGVAQVTTLQQPLGVKRES